MNLSRETLLDDFSTMLSDAEDLLKRAGNETGERAKDLRAQVEAKLLAAKLRLQELEGGCRNWKAKRPIAHAPPRASPTITCTTTHGLRSALPRSRASWSAC